MSVYVTTMDTGHFSFCAVGATEDEAISAMVQTMKRHRAQYGYPTWDRTEYKPFIADSSVQKTDDDAWLAHLARDYYGCWIHGPLELGAPGTRDGSEITLR